MSAAIQNVEDVGPPNFVQLDCETGKTTGTEVDMHTDVPVAEKKALKAKRSILKASEVPEHLRHILYEVDDEGDGNIEIDELEDILKTHLKIKTAAAQRSIALCTLPDTIQETLKVFDIDENGILSHDELAKGAAAYQREKVKTKNLLKVVGVMVVFMFLLLGCITGLVFAVVELSKETELNGSGVQKVKGTNTPIASGVAYEKADIYSTVDLSSNQLATIDELEFDIGSNDLGYTITGFNKDRTQRQVVFYSARGDTVVVTDSIFSIYDSRGDQIHTESKNETTVRRSLLNDDSSSHAYVSMVVQANTNDDSGATTSSTDAPTDELIDAPTDAPTAAFPWFCVRVTTGGKKYNDGYVELYVNDVLYNKGNNSPKKSVVFEDCYTFVPDVAVTSTENNAWTGAIEFSVDAGTTWSAGECRNCGGSTSSTSSIVVEADGNGGSQAKTRCQNGKMCIIEYACPLDYTATDSNLSDHNDVDSMDVHHISSAEACGEECAKDLSCGAYEYNEDLQRCKMKTWGSFTIGGSQGAGWVSCLRAPTESPTAAPTKTPTSAPTMAPTGVPTMAPTGAPTMAPTSAPTGAPTSAPTGAPTESPTTSAPTESPTTAAPTPEPPCRTHYYAVEADLSDENDLDSWEVNVPDTDFCGKFCDSKKKAANGPCGAYEFNKESGRCKMKALGTFTVAGNQANGWTTCLAAEHFPQINPGLDFIP